MRQDIIDLYDDYTHARLDRRVFMDRLAVLAGGTRGGGGTAAAAPLQLRQGRDRRSRGCPPQDRADHLSRARAAR